MMLSATETVNFQYQLLLKGHFLKRKAYTHVVVNLICLRRFRKKLSVSFNRYSVAFQLFDLSGFLAGCIYWNGLFLVSQIQTIAFQEIPADFIKFSVAVFWFQQNEPTGCSCGFLSFSLQI